MTSQAKRGHDHAASRGNAPAPRVLPATAPQTIALDTLLARAAPAPRRSPAPSGAARSDGRPANPVTADASRPIALVLCVTVATCTNCGTVTRAPNRGTLVRYDTIGHTHSIQYTRHEVGPFLLLPRETKLYATDVPFCEGCF